MVLFASVAILFGGSLGFSFSEIAFFATLASAPLSIRVLTKFGCHRCDIEFFQIDHHTTDTTDSANIDSASRF